LKVTAGVETSAAIAPIPSAAIAVKKRSIGNTSS
jgi:hypothetical protein